jgi:hypothetical protein
MRRTLSASTFSQDRSTSFKPGLAIRLCVRPDRGFLELLSVGRNGLAKGEPPNGIRGATCRPLPLGCIQVILHPIPRNGEEFGLQAGPFLLATRERAHIVATVPMTIEKLNLSGTPNGLFFYGLLHGISRGLNVNRINQPYKSQFTSLVPS